MKLFIGTIALLCVALHQVSSMSTASTSAPGVSSSSAPVDSSSSAPADSSSSAPADSSTSSDDNSTASGNNVVTTAASPSSINCYESNCTGADSCIPGILNTTLVCSTTSSCHVTSHVSGGNTTYILGCKTGCTEGDTQTSNGVTETTLKCCSTALCNTDANPTSRSSTISASVACFVLALSSFMLQ